MQSETVEEAIVLKPARAALRASLRIRARGVVLAAFCAGILWLAYWLHPRAAGYGTHQDLKLPPCAFLSQTGYPCPSCGLTTSFAALAHGQIGKSLLAHPCGIVLFAGVVALGLAGLAELVTGRDAVRLLRPGAWWAMVVGIGLLGGWAFKIAHGLATGVLPLR